MYRPPPRPVIPAYEVRVPRPGPRATPASNPTTVAQPSTDEEHVACLLNFFSYHRPEVADASAELFKKHGEKIWERLEKKYPGKTAEYKEV